MSESEFSNHSKESDEGETEWFPPKIPTDVPTGARVYGLALGSKDNFQVDRELAMQAVPAFPEFTDIARENRMFLYRAVRFLARDAGITQFLDLGSGLPTEKNVHEVAREFQPDARVVYVDVDPIAAAHGRALLVNDTSTAFLQADMTEPQEILGASETRAMLDFSRPVGVLMFSIPHLIPDEEKLREAFSLLDHVVPGSWLALSHIVADDPVTAQETSDLVSNLGLPWKTRSRAYVDELVAGLEPVEPGLVDINDWRPDPDQPPLSEAHPLVAQFVGAAARNKRMYEYGGVLRKPE